MKRTFAAALLVAIATVPAAAQNPRPELAPRVEGRGPRTSVAPAHDSSAPETQQRFYELLQQYPPSLHQVLRLDPSLLSNPAYLEPYPALAAFLAEHPEIAHNPGFFVGQYGGDRYNSADPKLAAIRSVEEAFAGLGFLIGFLTVVGTIGWLLRSVIEHRRWLRVSKTHTDTHTKLLDRLTSNEDLLAYMQSPAGRRFLEAAPIPLDSGPRALSAPLGRILWSVQAGCVVAFAGAGLMYSSTRFAANATFSEIELPFFVMGATAVAIGAGFVVSAIIAYGLSRRLGLMASPPGSATDTGAAPSQLS
jgi:hypothetical protein